MRTEGKYRRTPWARRAGSSNVTKQHPSLPGSGSNPLVTPLGRREPQPGEQAVPLTERFQATLLFEASLLTVAVNCRVPATSTVALPGSNRNQVVGRAPDGLGLCPSMLRSSHCQNCELYRRPGKSLAPSRLDLLTLFISLTVALLRGPRLPSTITKLGDWHHRIVCFNGIHRGLN